MLADSSNRLIFGGHEHIRDCNQLDGRSMTLASGRYMETVGWISVSGLDAPNEEPLNLQRRYLDNNRRSVRLTAIHYSMKLT